MGVLTAGGGTVLEYLEEEEYGEICVPRSDLRALR